MSQSTANQRMAKIHVVVRAKGKKWTRTVYWRATFTHGKDVTEYKSFEEAYRAAREYDKRKVTIDWHPDWMTKAIEKVENEMVKAEGKNIDESSKEKQMLKYLKEKYEGTTTKKKKKSKKK